MALASLPVKASCGRCTGAARERSPPPGMSGSAASTPALSRMHAAPSSAYCPTTAAKRTSPWAAPRFPDR